MFRSSWSETNNEFLLPHKKSNHLEATVRKHEELRSEGVPGIYSVVLSKENRDKVEQTKAEVRISHI